MPHEDYCYALERENHALNEKYESMRQRLSGANARIELMGETALNQQKREVMLRDWIRQQGEVTNTCTFNILKEVCNECACHRAKEQR